ncbi:MAG: acyl-CoA thioesterase [Planctomycetes bacterium]|nr:acyl-CoA thioesterase [Planctomycetota bacterium]
MAAFTTTVQVRFGHVDPAGIVYFPRIYDYIHEVFEEVWERHVDERYYKILSVDRVGFPLVHSEVDFKSPLRFGDRAQVDVTCFKLGRSSLGLRYRFSVDGRECVDARMVTACVDLATSKSFAMPERYRTAFEKIMEAA